VRFRRREPEPAPWALLSYLLRYPTPDVAAARPQLAAEVAALPAGEVRALLERFLSRWEALAARYVETFDLRRRACLELTYYAHGDTRNRGMALLELKQTYAAAGLALSDEELPDHLSVVLEFASATDDPGLLVQHRSGLELLRLALHDAGSPWADIVDSIAATLPPLAGHQRTAVARLAAGGPPAERVGLEPFGAQR